MAKTWGKAVRVVASAVLVLSMFPVQALAEARRETIGEKTSAEMLLEQFYADKEVEAESAVLSAADSVPATEPMQPTDTIVASDPEVQTITLDVSDDGTDLIAGYIEQCLDAELPKAGSSNMWERMNARPSTGLSGNDYAVYSALKPMIAAVAAGERTSTVFEIDVANMCGQTAWTAAELGVDAIIEDDGIAKAARDAVYAKIDFNLRNVFNALMADSPFELYWFDKTTPFGYSLPSISTGWSGGEDTLGFVGDAVITVRMPVSADYSASGQTGTYEVDPTTGQRVTTAIETAKSIAAGGTELSAYERLAYFKDQICELVDYNDAAAADDDMPYGDPWQLIYVFDGDASTNVVCEGYSKAFQYLCDLANMVGVTCITVTGAMSGGTGAGAHMWNLVNMDDGKVYLVDVTNCDSGTVGYPDMLFVVPYGSGNVNDGYFFRVGSSSIGYLYDSEMFDTYTTAELTISASAYVAPDEPLPSDGWTRLGTCEYQIDGDTLTIRPLGNGVSGVLPDTDFNTLPGVNDASVKHVVFASGVKSGLSLAGAFDGCSNLESIDFTGLDTSAATCMSCMFSGCSSLTELDLSGFDTSNDVYMAEMFSYCASLTSLDLSNFDTSNVTTMAGMFGECTGLETLDISGFDTSNVTDMYGMFVSCSSLTALDLSNFDTSGVTDMSGMFSACTHLASLDVTSFDTSNVTSMIWMFNGCSGLTSLDVTNFDTSNVIDMDDMFYDCSGLRSLDLSSFDTSNVTDMSFMFGVCSSLETLDLSNFDTSNVTNMEYMFGWCKSVKAIDVTSFDTSSVTNMNKMFTWCNALKTLDVSGFDTSNVTDMESMFDACYALEALDLSNFDTSDVTNMDNMFFECFSLTSLDVSGFDTSKLTSMVNMFAQCSSLPSLDVAGFDTSNITSMHGMFSRCSSLTSLDVTGFDTSSVTDMCSMFGSCSSLTSLDVTGFDTSNVTDMSDMFYDCEKLTTLDLSTFDTSNVTTMRYMFANCFALSGVDLSSFDTSNVTHMGDMFSSCFAMTSLDLSNFDTSNVTNMGDMFRNSQALVSLDLSGFDTSNVTDMGWMFYDCFSLKRLTVGAGFVQPEQDGLWSAPDGVWRSSADGNTYSGYELAHRAKADTFVRLTDLTNADVETEDQVYTGSALKPEVVVKLDGVRLTHGTDYDVAYSNNTEVGMATVTVTGKGDFVGTATGYFEILVINHNYVFVDVVPATCVKTGEAAHYICSDCGKLFVLEGGIYLEATADELVIPVIDHAWATSYTVDKAATCASEGSESIHCTVCGAQKEGSSRTIAKTDHTFGEWKVTKEATCTAAGSREKTCSACGDKVTETISAKGHTWATSYTVDKEATCTSEGSESIHCTVCGAQQEGSSRAIAKTDHTYSDWKVTKEATYFDSGSREKTCIHCGNKITETIAPLTHGEGWDKDQTGAWVYYNKDGSIRKNDWAPAGSTYYYLGADGHVVTNGVGYYSGNGKYYYLNGSGTVDTKAGWKTVGNAYFYVKSDGSAVVKGWFQYGGAWYYFGADGKLVYNGWVTYQGKSYYMGSNGKVCVNAWAVIDGKYCYFDGNGKQVIDGWVKYNGYWFYMDEAGHPVVNDWVTYQGTRYHFNGSGICDRYEKAA